jgi:hypothetical protein
VAQLGPTIVRIGGTAADYAFYLPDATVPGDGNAHTYYSNAIIDNVLSFFDQVGGDVQLMWDHDALQFRTADGAWDPTGNATQFLQYIQTNHPKAAPIIQSAGNEPGLWPAGKRVSTQQLGEDALALKKLAKSFNVGSTVYGPAYEGFSSDAGAWWRGGEGAVDVMLLPSCAAGVCVVVAEKHVNRCTRGLRSLPRTRYSTFRSTQPYPNMTTQPSSSRRWARASTA